MKATGATTADECRSIGLQVGQTIEGTDESGETARLTLQWLGDEVAVFRVTELCIWATGETEWTRTMQSADWSLSHREWHILEGGAA